jgi:phage shock protein C
MFCTRCGSQLKEQDNFCCNCGATTARGASNVRQAPPLARPAEGTMLAGVCAGFARSMGIDVTIIRIVWAILMLSGIGIVAYIVCWIVMPRDPVTDVAPVRASS